MGTSISFNFMKNEKQHPALLFAHCRGDISLPNIKITDNSINYFFKFHFENMRTIILFVKLEQPSETGKGRKQLVLVTARLVT